jgi:hypothetical protein
MAMQVFNSFQEMTGTDTGVQSTMDVFNLEQADCAVENNILDLSSGGTPPVTPAQRVGDNIPIPQRVKTLEEKVGALERKVENGFAEMRQGFAEIASKLK